MSIFYKRSSQRPHIVTTTLTIKTAMEKTSARHITSALTLLEDAAPEPTQNTKNYDASTNAPDSNEDNGCECPVFDQFYNDGGNKAVKSLTNFGTDQLTRLYTKIEKDFLQGFAVGRGERSKVGAKKRFSMLPTVLKNRRSEGFLARMFSIKKKNFKRMFLCFC